MCSLLLLLLFNSAQRMVKGQLLNYGWTTDTADAVISSPTGRVGATSAFVTLAPNNAGVTNTLFVFGGQTQVSPSSPLAGGGWSLLDDMWSRTCVS